MLGDAKGTNCQASNFSRAFTCSPQGIVVSSRLVTFASANLYLLLVALVAALGLMDHDGESSTVAYASLIQTFNRFLIDQMTAEADSPGRNPILLKSTTSTRSPMTQLLAIEARTLSTCQCGGQTSRDSTLAVVDLIYPRRVRIFNLGAEREPHHSIQQTE